MEGAAVKHSNIDGVESRETTSGKAANPTSVKFSDFLLRAVAIVISLVAITLLARDKQTKKVPITLLPNLPPILVEATAKWQYMSAFVYLMVVNIIAVVYGAISIALSLLKRSGSSALGPLLVIFDLIVVALLFSAVGAAAAVGIIAYHGNSHAMWKEICDDFSYSCHYTAASTIVTLAVGLVFIMLIIITVMNLRKWSLQTLS